MATATAVRSRRVPAVRLTDSTSRPLYAVLVRYGSDSGFEVASAGLSLGEAKAWLESCRRAPVPGEEVIVVPMQPAIGPDGVPSWRLAVDQVEAAADRAKYRWTIAPEIGKAVA